MEEMNENQCETDPQPECEPEQTEDRAFMGSKDAPGLAAGLGAQVTMEARNPNDPWAHRSTAMKCASCMWFVHKVSLRGPQRLGRCRRHAPTLGGYPAVFLGDWCGDHKVDETKI